MDADTGGLSERIAIRVGKLLLDADAAGKVTYSPDDVVSPSRYFWVNTDVPISVSTGNVFSNDAPIDVERAARTIADEFIIAHRRAMALLTTEES